MPYLTGFQLIRGRLPCSRLVDAIDDHDVHGSDLRGEIESKRLA